MILVGEDDASVQLRNHGEIHFAGITEKLRALHSPRLITLSNNVGGCLLLFRSHGVPESCQPQVPINLVGISIDLEGVPCLKLWLNLLDPVFELDGPSWVKVACSARVHPYPWVSLCIENGNKPSM